MFRVVQDQLRVSDGWVRCGRCDTVFNAFDALTDLDGGGVPPAPAEQWPDLEADPLPDEDDVHALATAPVQAAWRDPALDPAHAAELDPEPDPELEAALDPAPDPDIDPDAELDDDPEPAHAYTREATVHAHAPAAIGAGAAAAGVAAHSTASPGPAATGDTPALASAAWQPQPSHAAGGLEGASAPGFLRRAERDARWSSPAMRAALIGCAVLLALLALLQVAIHFRDDLAVRSQRAGSLLRAACLRWGCEVGAPRRLEQVKLEHSALSRVAQNPQAVRLSLQLRNRGRTAVALPAIDLTLTDVRGELIARRMLMPADFGVTPAVIPAAGELPLELTLGTGAQNVNSYTVELFYP